MWPLRKFWRKRCDNEQQARAARDLAEFEGIVRASYPARAGRVIPGRIPVIAPCAEDFPWEDNRRECE